MKVPSWRQLNKRLMQLRTEAAVKKLYERVRKAGGSSKWLRRIDCRYAKLRRQREKRQRGEA